MSGTHSRGESVSHYLLQGLDLPCHQPSTKAALTVSNPATTLCLGQGPQGRREAAAGKYSSLSLSGKQSNCRTHCTAILPLQSSWRWGGQARWLSGAGRRRSREGVVLCGYCHGPCPSWTVCCRTKCFAAVRSLSRPGKISHRAGQVHYVPCLLI